MNETKRKIIDVANELFALKGFSGTSIRDIANQADVNVASINYYFQNKQNLYFEVIEFHKEEFNNLIEEKFKDCTSCKEFALGVFDMFQPRSKALINTFKIILNSDCAIPEDYYDAKDSRKFGPPGFSGLLNVLDKQLPASTPEATKLWITRVIFNQIVHVTMITNTEYIKKKCLESSDLSPEYFKRSLALLIDSVLEFQERHPENWKE
ncbi:TetR family transcriptional regulator [Halobacteriovorax sp. GB3]|uniref:TetR family transcriptional regulator n=1 Tax=Halobacteriovorax sp. GB3 TaxID=2719615 RepID=UPI00235E5EC2|nr:TetR family transcriptional regulator [Halobacteriovorax sp. GB3]MDD0854038.1 TetR family transcriptional regulator [Halobacteriovorax sp. GB3]